MSPSNRVDDAYMFHDCSSLQLLGHGHDSRLESAHCFANEGRREDITPDQFKTALKEVRKQSNTTTILWAARCHHWIHEPQLSQNALTGTSSTLTK
jgi:hypothetical protein